MILSDIKIREFLETGLIEIDPYPEDIQFQPVSIDLSLGKEFKLFGRAFGSSYIGCLNKCMLDPGFSALAHTRERIKIGNGIVARIEGRSSYGRRFLTIHSTAGFIDSGFNGQITLELTNHSHLPITLEKGMKIAQIIFEESYPSDRLYGCVDLDSKYQNQGGAEISRIEGVNK